MEAITSLRASDNIGLDEFLIENPEMSIVPNRSEKIVIDGLFRFHAAPPNGKEIMDTYQLSIIVPKKFPKELPSVFETGGKIPREPKFHVSEDGSLCLGTQLRIMISIVQKPTLSIFTTYFIKPYLYAISLNRIAGGELIFGELDHGDKGILQDYSKILNLYSLEQIKQALLLLSIKKRLANKKPCPCGCGFRYGKCKYRLHLEKFRYLSDKEWFESQASAIGRNSRL